MARPSYIAFMTDSPKPETPKSPPDAVATPAPAAPAAPGDKVPEVGGRKGPEPTRYGDWEKDGRCVDF